MTHPQFINAEPIRVLIAGGLTAVRHGLNMSFSAEVGFEVIGEASSCNEALEIVRRCSPHILIVDLDVPEVDGLELTETVHTLSPRTAVILISMQDDVLACLQAKDSGATAFFPKTMPIEQLLQAIRQISVGTRRVYLMTNFPRPPFEANPGRISKNHHFVVSLKYQKR